MRVLRVCSANWLPLIIAALTLACLAAPALAQPQAEAGATPAPLEVQFDAPAWAQAWLNASGAALLLAAVNGPDTGAQLLPEATAALQAYLDQGRGDPRLYSLLGQLYLRRGLPSRALPSLQRAIPSAQYSSDPATAQQAKPRLAGVLADYYLGRAGLSSSPAAARVKLQAVTTALPQLDADVAGQPAALYLLAEAARLSGDSAAYTNAYFKLALSSQANALIALTQGRYSLSLGNAAQATPQFQQAIEFDHSLPEAWLGLAEVRRLQDDVAGAKVALANALQCAGGRLDIMAQAGAQRLLLGDAAGAEEAFRLALAGAPEDADVLAALGEAYLAAGNATAAAGYFTRALAGSANPLLACGLARAHLLNKDYATAEAVLAPAREALPHEPAMLLLSAQLAAAQGQAPVARAYFQQASAGGGLVEAVAFAEYLSAQKDAGAAQAWNDVITKHSANPQAWQARARWRLAEGQAADAAADCAQASELAPSCDAAEELWAQALAAGGDAAGAAEHYDRALVLDPSPAVYLAAIKLAEGEPALAGKLDGYWAALLKAYPQHASVLVADGERLLANGSYSAAAAALGRAAAALPNDARVAARYGTALAGAGDAPGALAQFKRSLALKYDPAVAGELATALVAAGQTDAAAQLWRELMLDYPTDAGLVMQYGLTLFNAGDFGGALEQYLRGEQLDPASDQFHNRAGLCLFKLGRFGEALSEVQAALKLRDDPQYYLNLAVGYEQFNDIANAEKFYRTGLERYPDYAGLRDGYTDFLMRQGQTAGALQRLWDAALAADSFELYQRIYGLALQANDPYTAEQACLAELRLQPGNLQAIQDYCTLLGDNRRWEELAAYLASLERQLEPQAHAQLMQQLTAAWLARGQAKNAQELLERLLAASPKLAAYYAAVAWLRLGSQDYAGALDTVKRGLNDAGRDYMLRYLEAYLTAQLFGTEPALPLAQALLDDPAADSQAYVLCSRLLGAAGRFAEQEATALHGLKAYPNTGELVEQLVRAYYGAQDYTAARQLLADPAYAGAQFPGRAVLLGYCYLDGGDAQLAADAFQRETQAQPASAAAWTGLAEARYFLGSTDETRSAATQALALEAGQPGARAWLALALLAQQDTSGAAATLLGADKASGDKAGLAWLALAQARVALAQGDRATAQQALDEAWACNYRPRLFTDLHARTRREAGLVN
jgi:tetratricopeptide (TPR) repeat protein